MATNRPKPDIDFETAYLGAVLANALASLKQRDVDALIGVANAFLAKDPKGRATLLSNVKRIYNGVSATGDGRRLQQPRKETVTRSKTGR